MARRKNCPASLMSAYVRESESGSSRQEGVVGVGLESTLKGGAFSMRTITSVGVLSVAKIMGAIYAVIGLILLPFFLLASLIDRKSTRLNSSHQIISYAVFCLKKKR